MSTAFPDRPLAEIVVHQAEGFPPATHPAEVDLFARHEGIPAHDQTILSEARILMIGAGGLGSWTGLGLVRSGIRYLIICDGDTFDRSNAPRQLLFGDDLGHPKAHRLARNLIPHMIAGGTITSVDLPFEEMIAREVSLPADVLICLVDNNACRRTASAFGRAAGLPAIFGMMSSDGTRIRCFLQGGAEDAACLWCGLPDLNTDATAPCASGVIVSCLMTASMSVFLTHRAIMGWPTDTPFNWWEADLYGNGLTRVGRIRRRNDCAACHLTGPVSG